MNTASNMLVLLAWQKQAEDAGVSRTCPATGKVVYQSREEAESRAVKLRKACHNRSEAYVCRHCGRWHLSTNRTKDPRRLELRRRERPLTRPPT